MAERPAFSEERQALAAELALGLIVGHERLEAERLRLEDREFDTEVRLWRSESTRWLATLPPQPAPEDGWRRLSVALSRGEADEHATDTGSMPVDTEIRAEGPGGWRIAAVAAGLAAVLFGGLWLTQRAAPRVVEPDAAPTMVAAAPGPAQPATVPADRLSIAQISDGEGGGWLVSAAYDPSDGTLYLRLSDIADEGRVPELWVIGEEGTPRSLGTANENSSQTIVLTPELQREMIEGSTLAVSLEEPSDVPRTAPAGPILGTAVLAPLASADGATGGTAETGNSG